MFCEKCGAKNSDKALFCEECGAKLEQMGTVVKERKPLSKVLIVEAVLCVALVVGAVAVYKNKMTPESVASAYVEACVGKDWGAVYDITGFDAKKKEFLEKEAYVTAKEINASEKEAENVIEIVSTNKITGSSGTAMVRVSYREGEDFDSVDVMLERKGLGWRVLPEDDLYHIYEGGQLIVPEGASVTIDKIELKKDMQDLKIKTEETRDVYELPDMFGTEHYVEVSAKGAEDFKGVQNFSSPVRISLKYSEEEYKNLTERAWEDLETILSGAINDKRYKDMKVFEDIHPQMEEETRAEFERLREEGYECGDDQYRIIKQKLSNVEVSVEEDYYSTEDEEIPCTVVEFGGDTESEELRTSTGTVDVNRDTEYYGLYYEKGEDGWKLIHAEVFDYFPEMR